MYHLLFRYGIYLALYLLSSNIFADAASSKCSIGSGVGFDLNLDYGTSAVSFPNGTAVAVAKIEGSPDYKRVMRLVNTDAWWIPPMRHSESFVERAVGKWLPRVPPVIERLAQKFLGRSSRKSADSVAMDAMFFALKVSIESYLGVAVDTVDVAVPYRVSDYHRALMNSASHVVGVRHALHTQVLAGQVASRANGIGECTQENPCNYNDRKPQVVLTVDYSRAALTMVLYVEERGVFEDFRIYHDVDLGSSPLACHLAPDRAYWERVIKAIKEIVQMPVPGVEPDVPNNIGQLVLLGESVTDPRLLEVLRDILGERAVSEARSRSASCKGGMVDPVFAAAIGVAAGSYEKQLDDCEFNNHGSMDL